MHVAYRHLSIRVGGAMLASTILFTTAPARADKSADKKECAQAYADAQKSMRSTTLRRAREQLNVCSRDVCISAVRKDCVSWLDEVNAGIPSVVVSARGPDNKETLDVKVSLVTPGANPTSPTLEVLATKLDVKGLELDPGTFTLRFERNGSPPIDQEVVLLKGQKNKQVDVSWAPAVAAATTTDKKDDKVSKTGDKDKIDSSPKQKSILPYVLGGAGVLFAAGGVFFWLKSESQRSDLKQTCAPRCSASDADDIKTQRLVGDILAAVGVIAIGAAVVWIVTDTSGGPKSNNPSGKWGRILTEGYAF